jgi:hypothetical protein
MHSTNEGYNNCFNAVIQCYMAYFTCCFDRYISLVKDVNYSIHFIKIIQINTIYICLKQ